MEKLGTDVFEGQFYYQIKSSFCSIRYKKKETSLSQREELYLVQYCLPEGIPNFENISISAQTRLSLSSSIIPKNFKEKVLKNWKNKLVVTSSPKLHWVATIPKTRPCITINLMSTRQKMVSVNSLEALFSRKNFWMDYMSSPQLRVIVGS